MRCLKIVFLITLFFLISHCRFDSIEQPKSALPGELIEIRLTISDNLVPEPNAHKGLLCILIPQDWSFVSGSYEGTVGSGTLELSAAWADSAEACYPANGFAAGMEWIALLSDTGYAYSDPISIDISVFLQVGQTTGCFDLAYLLTKATTNLLCTNWTPLSYPHRIGVPDSCATVGEWQGYPEPDWDDLFYRQSGWTGADGIYSIPLNGVDFTRETYDHYTLMTFGDTFIGEVDANNRRQNSILINNTYAIMQGKDPLDEQINFFWETNNGSPQAVFIPNTPESKAGDWYWPMDGVLVGDSVYVFGLRLDKSQEPFKPIGVNLFSFTVDPGNGIGTVIQKDTPLFYEPADKSYEIVLGQAVMDMTETSANPGADGYIYVLGPRSSSLKKDLVASRVRPEHISDFSRYEFWNGEFWGEEISECAIITSFISQEFSLSPLSEDQFLLVFQRGAQVAVRTGASPVGPFDIYRVIYDAPEGENDPDIFIYNAKGHPHLSRPGEMLISYNVNSHDFADLFNDAGIYRPRFISLPLEQVISINEPLQPAPIKNFTLHQNYPNPFNPNTIIRYSLAERGKTELSIFNLPGQKIITLVASVQNPGVYEVTWDGANQSGRPVAAGMYILRLRWNDQQVTRKMVLLQ